MMNAKEAKERALWLHLPIMLRSKIDAAIGRGELEVEYYYSDKISSDAINDMYNTLKELGYSVVIGNNNVLWICWGCYQWMASEADES